MKKEQKVLWLLVIILLIMGIAGVFYHKYIKESYYIYFLSNGSDIQKRIAAEKLGSLKSIKAIPDLIASIERPFDPYNVEKLPYCAKACADIGEIALPKLLEIFLNEKGNEEKRSNAARVICMISKNESIIIQKLKNALESGSIFEKQWALFILISVVKSAELSNGERKKLLEVLNNIEAGNDFSVNNNLIILLSLLNDGEKNLSEGLEKKIESLKDKISIDTKLYEQYSQKDKEEDIISLLLKNLRHPNPEVRMECISILNNMGKAALISIPILQELINDGNEKEDIRKMAKHAIETIERD